MDNNLFHLLFVALFGSLLALRIYFHSRAQTWKRYDRKREGPGIMAARLLVGLPLMIGAIVYMVHPSLMPWSVIGVPNDLRWLGFGLGVLGLAFGAWVHHFLGKNFSSELRIRPDHELVTQGPYRYVRHPMYTSFFVMMTGLFLLSGNWLICGSALLVLIFVMVVRTPREERMMVGRFGDAYRHYMARTGCYLPKLRVNY